MRAHESCTGGDERCAGGDRGDPGAVWVEAWCCAVRSQISGDLGEQQRRSGYGSGGRGGCSSSQQRRSERRDVLVEEIGPPSRAIAKLLAHLLKRLAADRALKPNASGASPARDARSEWGALFMAGPASRPLWPRRPRSSLYSSDWRPADRRASSLRCGAREPDGIAARVTQRDGAGDTAWAPARSSRDTH
jgi:hypothetical protein